jgi:hypothetical protein
MRHKLQHKTSLREACQLMTNGAKEQTIWRVLCQGNICDPSRKHVLRDHTSQYEHSRGRMITMQITYQSSFWLIERHHVAATRISIRFVAMRPQYLPSFVDRDEGDVTRTGPTAACAAYSACYFALRRYPLLRWRSCKFVEEISFQNFKPTFVTLQGSQRPPHSLHTEEDLRCSCTSYLPTSNISPPFTN